MTTMYSALVFPVTTQGYSTPTLPSTFLSLYATQPTWNPYSVNDIDRTQYWVDTAGTLTVDQVALAMFGLSGVQQQQILILESDYASMISQPITYTSQGNVTQLYPTGSITYSTLMETIIGNQSTGTVPTGFSWQAVDGTLVPFTFTDLQLIASVMWNAGWVQMTHLRTQIGAVMVAQTVLDVWSVVW